MNNKLQLDYFNWLLKKIYPNPYRKNESFLKLLKKLYWTDFTWIIPMDENREMDGTDLRYAFLFEYKNVYSKIEIENKLDNRPSSILEMMVALSVRCEESIMSNDDYGNRTNEWFWRMINSLGLHNMTDRNYDEIYIDHVLTIFLNREYEPNGKGGLFTVDTYAKYDLTTIEIWYQMNWYLSQLGD